MNTPDTPMESEQEGLQPRPDQSVSPTDDQDADEVEEIAEERIQEEVEHNRQGGH